ncbi:3-carboxy-cis,cis-muconate cycloisomerase [Denitrobaculum tricleocarpae]|uniref:3-carboxy-cis,cis-muconate cycloisomerase n=1 Tax=Denitrobaculum tricleocarpae TaxID=2591009 RepID=A0A545TYL5_9PROT|nr:3-carboxy-cis,cis-muconate cycloisomerase [Denitrobaculum tricleocarpae]TQV82284.1 3-carboxy-cis,cis-muconate cycloisomerase [Denitrobaculum tricleocarpae]
MAVSPLDSTLFQLLFSGREIAKLFSDEATVAQMLRVEAALARVQGRLGVIPEEAADAIDAVLFETVLPVSELTDGTGDAGVPVPALVAALRSRMDTDAGQYLHWGATSQDIVDTALVLTLASAAEVLEMRLEHSIQALKSLAERHRATVMVARTRSQQALPMTFGLKVANWLSPLLRHRTRLAELRSRLLVVQFGGAVGTLSALGGRGLEVMEALAAELKLQTPAVPWHTQRDGLAEFAGWLSLVTGSLGKIGQDIVLMSQNEVGEVREGGQALGEGARGGSSTMPQKSNPVSSEVLVTSARNNATLLPALHQALLQEHERGGAAWQLEWLSLPQMVVSTVVSLKHALYLIENLEVNAKRMRSNLEISNGLMLAEAATFALAEHLPRPEAQTLVKQCCHEAAASGLNLMDVLAECCDAPVDWTQLRDPEHYLGVTDQLIDRVLSSV